MRLKKLEVYGFKSFAEKVEIVFDDGITGIVGPNGSGKSNINDAVRWVLGEQSAKMLRGAKMEDVIFNGTEKRKRLSYCEVTLVFDNSDGGLAIEFAEVAVTRRAYRSGDSEYYINHNACRLKDITELFRDTGIGRDGYSLIGQGRIDEILSARSEDRRQVFEEASGIVKFKSRRKDAERRLENTRANLARVEDILTELENRLEPLRQQSETAREYLAVRDELKILELNVFLLRSTRYEQRIAELTQNAHDFANALNDAEQRRETLHEQRAQVEEQLAIHEAKAAQLREIVQELIRDTEARDGGANVTRERLSGETREKERLLALGEASEGNREGVEKQLGELVEKIAAEREAVAKMEAESQKAEEEVLAAEKAAEELEVKSENAKKALIAAMNRMSDMRSMQSRYATMLENIKARRDLLHETREVEEEKAGETRADLQRAKDRLDGEKQLLDETRERTNEAAARVRELNERTEALSTAVAGIQAQRREAQSRLKILREMQRDYEGYQNAVRQVLVQAKRLPNGGGVRGAVAEIMKVPAQYEKAIEMALGGQLQNVVVRTEEDAKRMIGYLRENRMGRATFLPMTSVRGRTLDAREKQLMEMPGCFGVASELVEYDGEYAEIIKFLLGRTVIAKDLDAGIAIMRAGRQAFRLVTLEGDVMNAGGSMTGGSVQSRMTSLLSREREIDGHEKLLRESEKTLADAAEELRQNEEERARLKKERGELFDAVHHQEIVCERQNAQFEAAQAAVQAREARLNDIDSELERLDAQEKDIRERLLEIESRQGSEQNTQTVSQAEISAMQKELLSARSAAANMRDALSAQKVELAARARGLSALEADANRLTQDSASLENAKMDNAQALEMCETRIAELAERLKTEEAELQEQREALKTQRNLFNEADGLRAAAQQELSKVSDRSEELRKETEAISDKKYRCDMSLQRTEGEYKQMCDRIWEDYELTYAGAEPFRKEDFKLGEADRRIAEIRARIREMGPVHVGAVDEYRQTQERVEELSSQKDDLTKADLDLQKVIEDLTKQMARRFTEQFVLLNENFQKTFVKLFGGGQASLTLTDPSDPLGCDIEIKAQPPGKKLTLLSLLSGGERALTAIAILFAMLKLKPTPFCFLDEIEAALDDANIDNFADYLQEFSKSTQFVVVTHRKGTMERCDSLYGVAMEEKGVTRLVSVRLNAAQEAI